MDSAVRRKGKRRKMIDFTIEQVSFRNEDYSVLDFGAKSDIHFNNQKAFQQAIDTCHEEGGGRVVIPNGFYYTGPIQLKSNVHLYLADNAFVQFTKSKEEYPLIWTNFEGKKRIRTVSPIWAKEAENIAITGKGILDGNGFLWRGIKKWKLTEKEWDRCLKISPYVIPTKEGGIWCPTKTYFEGSQKGEPDYEDEQALEKAADYYDMYRPVFVSFISCNRVLIEDVTLENSPAWNVHPLFCKNFTMRNAKIKNKFSAQNGDGLDLESCENCEIVGTVFEVGDDAICLKSGKNKEARQIEAPCKNVWIHNCKVFNAHGGFVVGSEMSRGVRHVLVENCTFVGSDTGIRFKSALGRGGVVEDILIRNIRMAEIVEEAVIFTMGYTLSTLEKTDSDKVDAITEDDVPEFKNISIENVKCSGAAIALRFQGLPQKPIHDITIRNSRFIAKESIEMAYCDKIQLEQVSITTPSKVEKYR